MAEAKTKTPTTEELQAQIAELQKTVETQAGALAEKENGGVVSVPTLNIGKAKYRLTIPKCRLPLVTQLPGGEEASAPAEYAGKVVGYEEIKANKEVAEFLLKIEFGGLVTEEDYQAQQKAQAAAKAAAAARNKAAREALLV